MLGDYEGNTDVEAQSSKISDLQAILFARLHLL